MTGRTPSAAKGHISARFPTFAEHGRKALAAAQVPIAAAIALESSADKDLHASAESADPEQGRPAEMNLEQEPSAAAEQATGPATLTDASSAADGGVETDASSSSADIRLQSPAKRVKQVFPE